MKKILFLLLEVVVIVFLVSILILLGINKYNDSFNDFSKYIIKFNDIDGLCVGAPVRVAGLHSGHVVKQELKNNKIFVIFKITDKNIKIPEGSVASIEFTGLAGSKSLEIKPPETKSENGQEFYLIEPLRVNFFFEIQNIISETVLDFSRAMLDFFNQNETTNLKNVSKDLKEKTILFENLQMI